jgi:serine phosphatase RsbU (regulator of sigma subunit)
MRERQLVKEKEVLEQIVKERTAEVVEKNEELAMKNKDILDSILYASRIQGALLPPELPFDNTFVLFRPKDIVSGDFFWFIKERGFEWISAVDCTGHGVPGAFMSIIGHNSLNKIVRELGIEEPAKILNQLDVEVIRTLNQYKTDNTIRDGMDIALIRFDPERRLLQFAGGCNPLYLIRNGELIETRANRYAIGMSETEKDFTNNEIQIESGDSIYIFSDGYADQFGGPDGKKLKIGKFKEYILKLQGHPMNEQKELLNKYFEDWVGNHEQVDDVTVIGRQFLF